LRFNQKQANVSQRRRRSLAQQKERRILRAAIEATVRQVKHPFPASNLPVRGLFRVACMVIGSAAVSNVRRIQCYLEAKIKLENVKKNSQKGVEIFQESIGGSIFAWLKAVLTGWGAPIMLRKLSSGC
jgi:hypothetical protein